MSSVKGFRKAPVTIDGQVFRVVRLSSAPSAKMAAKYVGVGLLRQRRVKRVSCAPVGLRGNSRMAGDPR